MLVAAQMSKRRSSVLRKVLWLTSSQLPTESSIRRTSDGTASSRDAVVTDWVKRVTAAELRALAAAARRVANPASPAKTVAGTGPRADLGELRPASAPVRRCIAQGAVRPRVNAEVGLAAAPGRQPAGTACAVSRPSKRTPRKAAVDRSAPCKVCAVYGGRVGHPQRVACACLKQQPGRQSAVHARKPCQAGKRPWDSGISTAGAWQLCSQARPGAGSWATAAVWRVRQRPGMLGSPVWRVPAQHAAAHGLPEAHASRAHQRAAV
jgi:hypothetical protein